MGNLLRRMFLDNFPYKLASLLLAIGLWLAVAHDPIAEIEMRIPIELTLPDNIVVDSGTFTQAQVRLRGPERLIHHLEPGDVRAEVDLGNVQPGERTVDLTARHVHIPSEVENEIKVEQIIPGQFHLTFDNRDQRILDVHPRVVGSFASGMRVAQVIADPPNITVTGPRHRLETLDSATTDPVDVSGTISRASFVTEAYVADPLVQVVHPRPVRVTVIMERAADEKKKE